MAAGTIERPTQLAPGDHSCWGYASPASKADAVLAFLDEGAMGGDQLLYVGPGTAEELTRHLTALPHRRDLFESGQLSVSPLADFYGTWDDFDVDRQLETFRRAGRQARAAGYRSLRCVADLTPLAEDPDDKLLHYELAIGAVVAAEPLTGLCLYDEARSGAVLPAVACTHALRHGDELPVPFSLHAGGDGRYHLTGDADFTAVPELRRMLGVVAARQAGAITIDVDHLTFLDVATARVLAAFVDRQRLLGRAVRFHATRQPPLAFLAFGLDAELDDGITAS
jgi:anti-anti-sigma regulatory factor